MSLFTSDRERRLWLWTLVLLIAIYATLGLAGKLAEEFRNRGFLNVFFALSAFFVLVIIVTQGLSIRPKGVEIAARLSIAVAYLMIFIRMGIPAAERTHLIDGV